MSRISIFSLLLVIGIAFFGSASAVLLKPNTRAIVDDDEILGVGIVRPRIQTGARLYFYNRPQDFDRLADMATPVDSLVFGEGRHHVPINYAPPWFLPEYMALDYDALLLRAVTVSRNWIEVVVNTSSPRPRFTPHTFWVARSRVELSFWPEFLLHVSSVEMLDVSATPLRQEPSDNAGVLPFPAQSLLRPLAIQGYWMQVATIDDKAPVGWLR
ncbi:MAG TPA: hypothetical protein VKP65_14400 [Rhodothermales bacterium]|nr:hypothetical protein [Rhodothermales bacterium]